MCASDLKGYSHGGKLVDVRATLFTWKDSLVNRARPGLEHLASAANAERVTAKADPQKRTNECFINTSSVDSEFRDWERLHQ